MREPFDPLRHVSGRLPGQRGEVLVNRKLAEDEHLSIGQRVGVTTRTGIKHVRLVGIADYGNVASIGGATLIVAPMADVQSWYGLEGKVSRVVASAAPGVTPTELVARLRQALPRSLEIKTGEQTAADDAKQANDSIGSFLTPALLAFSGAALLVGAFIIFNTFSISVAQRRREFALLRSMGATRRQVLFARRRRGPRARRHRVRPGPALRPGLRVAGSARSSTQPGGVSRAAACSSPGGRSSSACPWASVSPSSPP